MPNDYSKKITQINHLILEGSTKTANALLNELTRKIPLSTYRMPLAKLARRLRRPELALKILRPYFGKNGDIKGILSDPEKVVLGATLMDIGSLNTAREILSQVNLKIEPEALLFLSFIHFARWEYREAIPLFDSLLERKDLPLSRQIVALANRTASLVYLEDKQADDAVLNLIETAKKNNYAFAEAYGHLLGAELGVHRKNWVRAELHLEEASKIIQDPQTIEHLLIEKWKAILSLYQGKESASNELAAVREKATKRAHYETLRSCDFHEALVSQKEELYLKVFWGTPFESLRNKLKYRFSRKINPGESYILRFDEKSDLTRTIDLSLPKYEKSIRPGQMISRMLTALTEDFYKPRTLPELHASIFPEERYHPVHSPTKIYQLIKRTRQTLKTLDLPISIEEKEAGYSLSFPVGVGLKITRMGKLSPLESSLDKLSSKFPDGFTLKEAEKHLGLSRSSTQRLVWEAEKAKILVSERVGKSLRYLFAEKQPSEPDTKIAS